LSILLLELLAFSLLPVTLLEETLPEPSSILAAVISDVLRHLKELPVREHTRKCLVQRSVDPKSHLVVELLGVHLHFHILEEQVQ